MKLMLQDITPLSIRREWREFIPISPWNPLWYWLWLKSLFHKEN
jgi:hypothetical protein